MSAISTTKRAMAAHVWARDGYDWYVEPPRVTDALLHVERFVGRTWDPCCGRGNIPGAFIARGLDAVGTDIIDRGADPTVHGWLGCRDFIGGGEWLPGAINAVSNPPFYRAVGTEQFIRSAIEGASGKVAVFVDFKFLSSQRRAAGIYAEQPPHRVWIIAERPSCPPGEYLAAGNEAGGGTADFCWLVWDLTVAPATHPQLGWLR